MVYLSLEFIQQIEYITNGINCKEEIQCHNSWVFSLTLKSEFQPQTKFRV